MIQILSFMWLLAFLFGFVGFLRGWNRELVGTAGILVALFALFQFDAILRSYFYSPLSRDQVFLIQAGIFLAIVFVVYQAPDLGTNRSRTDMQAGFLGAVVGAINGYLVGGTLWYFMDINEYPLPQFIVAPTLNSPTAQNIGMMPLVLLGGGASGTGDTLAIAALLVFLIVIVRTQ